ncbi:helix-turn-helix domain-containing protein [Mucilaginibacter calamicampi]
MMFDPKPYVGLPNFNKLTRSGLQYIDIQVYTALKWYNNAVDNLCFPTHETISERSGVCKKTVIASIKRLERSGVIDVKRSDKKNKSNLYYFARPWHTNSLSKIPKDYFEATSELSSYESAMLLCVRQFFNEFRLQCHAPKAITHFASELGLTREQVRKQFSSLISKGFVEERFVIYKKKDKVRTYYQLTNKVDWDFSMYEKPVKPYVRFDFLKYECSKFGLLKVA